MFPEFVWHSKGYISRSQIIQRHSTASSFLGVSSSYGVSFVIQCDAIVTTELGNWKQWLYISLEHSTEGHFSNAIKVTYPKGFFNSRLACCPRVLVVQFVQHPCKTPLAMQLMVLFYSPRKELCLIKYLSQCSLFHYSTLHNYTFQFSQTFYIYRMFQSFWLSVLYGAFYLVVRYLFKY